MGSRWPGQTPDLTRPPQSPAHSITDQPLIGEIMTAALDHADVGTRPWQFPCLVTTTLSSFTVDGGVLGAAASVNMLRRDYGLRAWWTPIADDNELPYAFVALGFRIHVAWFPVGIDVDEYARTACGKSFHTRREVLLGRPIAACTGDPCAACLSAWRKHYDN